MIFYPFIRENGNWLSMDQVMEAICAMGNIEREQDTIMNNGIMDNKIKQRVLSNIRVDWRKRVGMTNTSVTAGLNFDVNGWFHSVYACVSNFQSPREIIKWLSRARHIIDQHVYIVRFRTKNPKLINDILKDDLVFTHLVVSVNTEQENTAQGVMECFAVDAGYVLRTDNSEFWEEVMRAAESRRVRSFITIWV